VLRTIRSAQCGVNDGANGTVAAKRQSSLASPTSLKHNGQRWCALAVQDYESRALPLNYGGEGQ